MTVFFDGGSRPCGAGCGIIFLDEGGGEIWSAGFALGKASSMDALAEERTQNPALAGCTAAAFLLPLGAALEAGFSHETKTHTGHEGASRYSSDKKQEEQHAKGGKECSCGDDLGDGAGPRLPRRAMSFRQPIIIKAC